MNGAPPTPASRPAPAGCLTLLVIAKEPRPGRVKTRLGPRFTPRQAARLAEAALTDTLHTLAEVPARRRVLALAGRPGRWLPAGFEVIPQCGGGLDRRLAAAFLGCAGPTLLVGMDTPQLTGELLAPVTRADGWRECDAWFGPAADGGFWALGLADPAAAPGLLHGVPMSTPHTGRAQRERLTGAGLRVRDLPVVRDVDTPEDAAAVAAQAPGSRFAALLTELGGSPADTSDASDTCGTSDTPSPPSPPSLSAPPAPPDIPATPAPPSPPAAPATSAVVARTGRAGGGR